jgi:DNA-binding MarR family transcriptional regulator
MNFARSNAALSEPLDDLETRAALTDQLDLRLWLRMMAVHKLITNEARRRLRASFNMSLSRFDLMAQLDATKVGLRMGEISNRLMVTTGNITGLTDELEADGLVERAADPHSRRASLVRLTPKGRKLFRAAAKANAAWIAEFFSMLPAKDKKMFFFAAQKAFLLTAFNIRENRRQNSHPPHIRRARRRSAASAAMPIIGPFHLGRLSASL